ncbi:hypothetical protein HK096_011621, partial [Nowakowskiella sp. JEL0078]
MKFLPDVNSNISTVVPAEIPKDTNLPVCGNVSAILVLPTFSFPPKSPPCPSSLVCLNSFHVSTYKTYDSSQSKHRIDRVSRFKTHKSSDSTSSKTFLPSVASRISTGNISQNLFYPNVKSLFSKAGVYVHPPSGHLVNLNHATQMRQDRLRCLLTLEYSQPSSNNKCSKRTPRETGTKTGTKKNVA